MMRFDGRIQKDGRFWLVEVPSVDAATQGRSRKEALEMIADWFRTAVDRRDFRVTVRSTGPQSFEVSSSDVRSMVALLLQRQRQASGLSLAQVAERLGARSRNAYARYENGSAVPTVEKLEELLRAVAPNCAITVAPNRAA